MTRWLPTFALAMAGATMLTGCGGAMPIPTDSSTGAATPSPTATSAATVAPEPEPLPALVLPTCEQLFTADEVRTLMGESMELIGDVSGPDNGGYGVSEPELQAVLEAGPSINCTWIRPATERGLSVSVMEASIETQDLIRTLMAAAGSAGTSTGGESVIYAYESSEFEPFTEANYLSPEIWVSALDVNGRFAPALTQAAMDTVAELNPAWFRP